MPNITLDFKPTKKQQLFFRSEAKECLFGGSAGGGKSWSLRWLALIRSLKIPKHMSLILRKTYADLEMSQIRASLEEFPREVGRYIDNKKRWEFVNGSIIDFGYIDSEKDIYRYQSSEYELIAFDELTHFTENQYTYLISRLRTNKPNVQPIMRAATNPGGIGHCVPYGEILTQNGWKDIKEINIGDKVASLNEKREIVYKPVKQLHKHSYNGKLFSYKNSVLKITCTPEHRIARKIGDSKNDTRFKLEKAKNLPNYSYILRKGVFKDGQRIDTFTVPDYKTRETRLNQPKTINGDNYVKLMGWFLSEGYTLDRDKEFGISQMKPKYRKEIKKLFDEIGFSYRETPQSYIVSSPEWWSYLRQFDKCDEKYIPENILNTTPEQLKLFFLTMIKGDGSFKGKSLAYYSISEKLVKQMGEIGIKLGYVVTFYDRLRKNRTKRSYEVRFKYLDKVGDAELVKKNAEYIDYSGFVYDIGVEDTHNFFIRQDDTVWVSGNSWVKARFIDPAEPYEIWKPDRGGTRQFIPAKVYDNPYINQEDYIENLEALPEDTRKALLDGDWNVFGGQVFKEFDPKVHVITPFKIPTHWQKIMGYDYGYTKPFAVLWAAVASEDYNVGERKIPKGSLVFYREYYGNQPGKVNAGIEMPVREVAWEIIERENELVHVRVADPSIWAKSGHDGPPLSEIFSEEGLYFMKGDNDRLAGKMQIHDRLRLDGEGNPRLFIMDNCRHLIRTLPALPYDPRNTEDVDTDAEDHLYDVTRYICMSRPHARKKKKREKRRVIHRDKYTGY